MELRVAWQQSYAEVCNDRLMTSDLERTQCSKEVVALKTA